MAWRPDPQSDTLMEATNPMSKPIPMILSHSSRCRARLSNQPVAVTQSLPPRVRSRLYAALIKDRWVKARGDPRALHWGRSPPHTAPGD